MTTGTRARAVRGARQFGGYFAVALVGYLVDFGTLFLLTSGLHLHYLIGTVCGFVAGLIVVYVLSERFVFSDPKIASPRRRFALYAVIGLVGLGILSASMWLLAGVLALNYLVAKVIATVVVYLWNFFARRAMYRS